MSISIAFSITNAISQTLSSLYPRKIANDFHQYLKEEEYDSEVIKDDLREQDPFIVDHLITQNPSVFNNEKRKNQLNQSMQQILAKKNQSDSQKKGCQTNQSSCNRSQISTALNQSIDINNDINQLSKNLNQMGTMMNKTEESMKLVRELTAENEKYVQQMRSDEKYAQKLAHQQHPIQTTSVAVSSGNREYKYVDLLNRTDYDFLYEFGYDDGRIEKGISTIIKNIGSLEVDKEKSKIELNEMLDALMPQFEERDSSSSASCSINSNVSYNSSSYENDADDDDECKSDDDDDDNQFELDSRWSFVHNELIKKYMSIDHANKYYTAVIELISKKRFEMDDALEDLYDFAKVDNNSDLAESIMDAFGWHQNDLHLLRLITYLKQAINKLFTKKIKKKYKKIANKASTNSNYNMKNNQIIVNNNDNSNHSTIPKENEDDIDMDIFNLDENDKENDINLIKDNIAVIINLKKNEKYNKKMKKYDLFARALSVFGERQFCCLLRLYLRQKMMKKEVDIVKFIQCKFPEQYKHFGDDKQFDEIFKISFNTKLLCHRSILRKLNEQYHREIDMKLLQIWMTAIVMKMNDFYYNKEQQRKYYHCHSVFCIRFQPQQSAPRNHRLSMYDQVCAAYKMLNDVQKENESEMDSDSCWCFIINLSNDEITIDFEKKDLFDDEVMNEKEYNNKFKMNPFYHLKKIDDTVCKNNDNYNNCMALQLSLHKYHQNNCVSWLTHSSGHLPFFENDIVKFIPKLFSKCSDDIKDDEWNDIVEKCKFSEFSVIDRMYSEMQKCFKSYIKNNN